LPEELLHLPSKPDSSEHEPDFYRVSKANGRAFWSRLAMPLLFNNNRLMSFFIFSLVQALIPKNKKAIR